MKFRAKHMCKSGFLNTFGNSVHLKSTFRKTFLPLMKNVILQRKRRTKTILVDIVQLISLREL